MLNKASLSLSLSLPTVCILLVQKSHSLMTYEFRSKMGSLYVSVLTRGLSISKVYVIFEHPSYMTLFSRIVSLACLKYFILQADAHLTKIQQHITGVKVHSSDRNFIFTWTDLFHPNLNITMNCLVHVLDEVCKVNYIYIQSRKRWDLNYEDTRQSYCKAVLLCTGQRCKILR